MFVEEKEGPEILRDEYIVGVTPKAAFANSSTMVCSLYSLFLSLIESNGETEPSQVVLMAREKRERVCAQFTIERNEIAKQKTNMKRRV